MREMSGRACRPVQELARAGAIPAAYVQVLKSMRWKEPRIDAAPIAFCVARHPVRDAAAGTAPMKIDIVPSPCIGVGQRAVRHGDDVAGRVVGPEHAVTVAERAVAFGHFRRKVRNGYLDGAAMTGGDHFHGHDDWWFGWSDRDV